MKRALIAVVVLVCAGACSTPRVEQPPSPPHRIVAPARIDAPARTPIDEQATERFLDQEIARRSPPPPEPTLTNADRYRQQRAAARERKTTDEAATELFLDHEIERRRSAAPVVEPRTIIVREYGTMPVEVRESWHYGRDRYRSRFPWNTALGAGLGAVIGHQSGHRDEGAAIGAGLGLLFDLSRW